MSSYSQELEVALRAVHLASLVTKQHLLTYQSTKKHVDESTKADASEVTVADFAAQAILISTIHHVFPNDAFIAEESSDMLRSDEKLLDRVWTLMQTAPKLLSATEGSWTNTSIDVKLPSSREEMLSTIDLGQAGGKDAATPDGKRSWILDPIDGTKTYIRGQQYAVCLCLIDKREQTVAAIGCPNLNLEQRDADGRLMIEETIVDLQLYGGWILSAIKGHGTCLSRMRTPSTRQKLEEVLKTPLPDGNASYPQYTDPTEPRATLSLQFIDSTASNHISKDLHDAIFEHFGPQAQLSQPVTPGSQPSLALDIWSQQLKYILLALRAAHADAMVRTPPLTTYHAAVWDHAGGQLLLAESGGALSDANGKEFVIDGGQRKLGEWGVVAVRGGEWGGNGNGGMGAKDVHGVLLERVLEEVERRKKEMEGKGNHD